MFTRPVWAEISRRRLLANFDLLRRQAGDSTEVMAVVKGNAYGHGVLQCAQVLDTAGARWFGVTCVEEGVRLRGVCPEARIAIMGGLWHGEAEAVVEHRLTPFVWQPFHLDLLEKEAVARGVSGFPVHLELDTGMARQGVSVGGSQVEASKELEAMLARLGPGSALRLEAISTHFASSEALNSTQNVAQIDTLEGTFGHIRAHDLHPLWVSAGSSATLLAGRFTERLRSMAKAFGAGWMVRTGIALYGYPPRLSGDAGSEARSQEIEAQFRPVLAWKTRVNSLRTIEAGESAGYNATFKARRRTKLALLPVGYADGLSRLLSNRGSVLVRGQRAPIAGRVSMDQTIVDVTDVSGVEIGDEAVLIGEQGAEQITAEEIAELTGTISYEVLCAIAARVPRVMVE